MDSTIEKQLQNWDREIQMRLITIRNGLQFIDGVINKYCRELLLFEYDIEGETLRISNEIDEDINDLFEIGGIEVLFSLDEKYKALLAKVDTFSSLNALYMQLKAEFEEIDRRLGEKGFLKEPTAKTLREIAEYIAVLGQQTTPKIALEHLSRFIDSTGLKNSGYPYSKVETFLKYSALQRIKHVRNIRNIAVVMQDLIIITELIKILELIGDFDSISEILFESKQVTRNFIRGLNKRDVEQEYIENISSDLDYLKKLSSKMPLSALEMYINEFRDLKEFTYEEIETLFRRIRNDKENNIPKTQFYKRIYKLIVQRIRDLEFQLEEANKKKGRNPKKGIKKGTYSEEDIRIQRNLQFEIEAYSRLLFEVRIEVES